MNQTVKILNEMVEEFEIISESTEAGKLTKIKGLFTTVEARNKNGRIYPKSIFVRMQKRLNSLYYKEIILHNYAKRLFSIIIF